MGFGVSTFLIAVGAVLAFAVNVATPGIDLNVVGVILMLVGVVGLALSAMWWYDVLPWGGRTVVREHREYSDGVDHDHVRPAVRRRVVERRETYP